MKLHKYIFFFLSGFFSQTLTMHRTGGEGKRLSLFLLTFATDLSPEYLNLIEI